MADLDAIRKEIDSIDSQILDLFEARMGAVSQVAAYKHAHGLPILDKGRERRKLARVAEQVAPEYRDYAVVLFNTLMEVARTDEASTITGDKPLIRRICEAMDHTADLFPQDAYVACQGVEGSYQQLACDKVFRHPTIAYFSTFEGVFKAVEEGYCAYGILPLENSTAGTVNQVYDLMVRYDFHIVRTCRLKVDHYLLGSRDTTLENLTDIYSHQQAIDQCADFLASLEGVKVHMVENTAAAAKLVSESGKTGLAAIGSRACTDLYDLSVVKRDIQDMGNNYTRFAVISKDLEIYPGADRTSLMITTSNDPGSLYKVLGRFFSLDINLIKLESRPLPDRDFEYLFYFDMLCPTRAPEFLQLIGSLGDICEDYRYLGSYTEVI